MRGTAKILGAAAAVALVAGCTSKSGGGLSVSTRASVTTGAASSSGLVLPNGITITRIRMAVRRISVEGGEASGECGSAPASSSAMADHGSGSGGDGGSGSGGSGGTGSGPGRGDDGEGGDDGKSGPRVSDDGGCELSFGPFDVDLAGSALSGSIAFAFDAPIPPGTYEEVKIKINTVSAAHAGGNPVLEDLAAAHASIIVDGFVQEAGTTTVTPFTFSTPMEVKQKREGQIVIGPGSNVTLDFDPSHWFDGPSGRLDPTDPTAQGAILANIRASIRIIKDDDHDGLEDDDEHHGGGGDDGPNHH